ncbi:MAG: hypothetical protein Q8P25_02470 [Candidatus Curtissbacteria bacterium]|nr:hypothetical protein [Candidatus Curtissbacteria bacterium]
MSVNKETGRSSSQIALTTGEKAEILLKCQGLVKNYYDSEYEIEWASKYYASKKIAQVLVDRSKKDSFTVREMEQLFGVPRRRQIDLVESGLSPARLKDKSVIYDQQEAGDLLLLEELRKFMRQKDAIGWLGFEKKNFPYWAVRKEKFRQERLLYTEGHRRDNWEN